MNFLLAGGAGSVGRDLADLLTQKGHAVRVIDKSAAAGPAEYLQGSIEDPSLVRAALRGIDVVVHLAWSFSDDPVELVQADLKAHAVLLEACAAAKVARLFYASSAVVYGRPVQSPVVEDDPCLVEEARKPFYAAAKLAAEKLALAFWKARGLPVTILRFWWSYGDRIGGRHLRDLMAQAKKGEPLKVPGGAGGSFLDHADLAQALLLAAAQPAASGQVFNLATAYLEWTDIARLIVQVARSSSAVQVVPAADWTGPAFLADRWELSTVKAERLFGYRSLFAPAAARERLRKAMAPASGAPQ